MNHSYGLQLALAWDQPASISTRIPAASGDVTRLQGALFGRGGQLLRPTQPRPHARRDLEPGPDDPGLHHLGHRQGRKGGNRLRRQPTLRHRAAPDHGRRDQPDTHRAQPGARAAVGLRRTRRRPLGAAQARAQVRRSRRSRRPARSSSPTCASRRRPRARQVYTDKLADVPPTAPAPVLAPETGTTAAAVTAPQTIAAPSVRPLRDGLGRDRVDAGDQAPPDGLGHDLTVREGRQGDGHEARLEPQAHAQDVLRSAARWSRRHGPCQGPLPASP